MWDDKGPAHRMGPRPTRSPRAGSAHRSAHAHLGQGPQRGRDDLPLKAVGEPPLMLGISVLMALSDAVASVGDGRIYPALDTPATPERILMTVERIKREITRRRRPEMSHVVGRARSEGDHRARRRRARHSDPPMARHRARAARRCWWAQGISATPSAAERWSSGDRTRARPAGEGRRHHIALAARLAGLRARSLARQCCGGIRGCCSRC